MAGKSSRQKGFAFERELVNKLRDAGFDSERAWGSDGRNLGEHSEVDIRINHADGRSSCLQAKRTKKFPERYIPSDDSVHAVIVRGDRQGTYAIIRWDTYLAYLRGETNADD